MIIPASILRVERTVHGTEGRAVVAGEPMARLRELRNVRVYAPDYTESRLQWPASAQATVPSVGADCRVRWSWVSCCGPRQRQAHDRAAGYVTRVTLPLYPRQFQIRGLLPHTSRTARCLYPVLPSSPSSPVVPNRPHPDVRAILSRFPP
jgi:hypothetical protein